MTGSCNHYERKDAPSTAKLSRVVTTERAFLQGILGGCALHVEGNLSCLQVLLLRRK